MPNTIDTLEIQIAAQTRSANGAFSRLVGSLEKLDKALSTLDATPLTNLADGVNNLTGAMIALNASGVKTADFTRLTKNIARISNTNIAGLNKVASGLRQITTSFVKLSGVSLHSKDVADMASAIGKLGGTYITRATQNIPSLTLALKSMFEELSKAPRISSSIIQMTNALANLASNGSKVGSATRTIQRNLNSYGTSAYRASKHTLSLASAFGKFYATYFLVIRGIKGLWKSVQSSMDYVETFNYFNVTMKKIGENFKEDYSRFGYESADAYEESFVSRMNDLTKKMTGYSVGKAGELSWANIDNLGLDPNQLMNFQARLGAITNSVGLVGEASVQTSKALSMLSADLSSLTNTSLDTVMTNLSSGIIGMSRSLYKYGIDITNASLATVALENGVTKSVSAMSQSEKMQLRVLAILKQSKISWGDIAYTLDSVANQYRVFTQQVANLGRVLGNLFLPIVKRVLPYVNGIIIAMTRLFETLGFKIFGDSWLTDLMDGISGASFDIEELEEGLDGAGDELEADAKSANKLKKALQGFDELNVISLQDSNDNIGLADTIDLSLQIKEAVEEYERNWNSAFETMQNKAKLFAEYFYNAITGKGLGGILEKGLKFINEKLKRMDFESIGKTIGEIIKKQPWESIFFEFGRLFWYALNGAILAWEGSFETAPIETAIITALALLKFTPLGGIITKAIGNSIATSLASVGGIGGLLTTDMDILIGAGSFSEIAMVVGATFVSALGAAFVGLNIGIKIGEWIAEAIHGEDYSFSLMGAFDYLFSGGFLEDIRNGVWADALKLMSDDIGEWYKQYVVAIFTPSTWYDLGVKALGGLRAGIQAMLSPITLIIKVWYNTAVKSMFSKANWIFPGITDGLKQAFDNAISTIKNVWNNFAKWLNEKLTFSWNDVTIGGVKLLNAGKIDLGKIPTFSNGGFVSADMFFANENGVPELVGTVGGRTAVASGTEITGISDAVYDTGATQASLLSTAVGLLQIIADKEFGGSADDIFNSVRRSAQNYTNRTGSPAFPI